MSDVKSVRVYDTAGNTYLMTPAEAEKAVASGIYTSGPGGQKRRTEVVKQVSIAENAGKVAVYDKDGTEYHMFPVDAREAVKLGYTTTKPGADDEEQDENSAEISYKDEDGKYLALPDVPEVTKAIITEALKDAGESFRGNASRADLLKQWNAFVEAQDEE